jgi:ribosomal protein S18 acetylase RimI-like enzyme
MSETGYQWRDTSVGDLAGLDALDEACFHTDGPELLDWGRYKEKIGAPDCAMQCAMTPSGDIAAVAWAHMGSSPAMLGGRVHPEHRRKGLGSAAVRWAEAEAAMRTDAVTIRNESHTDGAQALYEQMGYTADFIAYWMNCDLTSAPNPELPKEIRLETWSDANNRIFYDTFINSFQDRGGPRESAEEWINGNQNDDDFRADLCYLAYVNDQPVAFVNGATIRPPRFATVIGWISQIGVCAPWRGRGIAGGLIGEIGRRLLRDNITAVGLDVNVNNPRAKQVYDRTGFKIVGRRAKFSKILS